MGKVKKVKISAAKRSQHLKTKKNFNRKQVNQRTGAEAAKSAAIKNQNNLFSSKNNQKYKQDIIKKKQKKKFNSLENKDEDSDETSAKLFESVQDILDNDDDDDENESKIDPTRNEDNGLNQRRNRKRKYEEDIEISEESKVLEKQYTKRTGEKNSERKLEICLLPIKSRDGEIITRTAQVDYKPKTLDQDKQKYNDDDENDEAENSADYENSDDDIVNDEHDSPILKEDTKKVISTADLLILREQEIARQKYRIGIICSGILEKPEDKMKNFSALFELMDECNENGILNLLTVRKLACASISEVFKDILPEYRVGQIDTKMQTIRKATLQRVTFENALLQQFKKYLQKLEKITAVITKKGGKKTPPNISLCEVAVKSLCDILLSHPYFNYVQNVAQLLVYMLNSNYATMREDVNECFKTLFATDKRLDMTLFIVRRINHLIKSKSNNVHLEMLSCLMALKIKNVNLDAEKENELKKKKLENHRQRLMSLSKKEKKRRKKLVELNKELQETKAEENKQSKLYKLTEIIKMVFTIFFRILKNDPNTKLLSTCLEGLSEFAHVINLEFFSDLIEVLNNLLDTTELGHREQLHCIQTIFVILSGQGEVLNIDPIRFYIHLYRNLLVVHAGKNHEDFIIILKTLNEVLIKRRKNITQQRMLAFIKRILTLSLQLLHNGTLGALGVVKTVMQLTSTLDIILDTDCSIGSGRFDSELDDPEYCNANCTSLYELSLLHNHYHPIIKKMAMNIAMGVPGTGDGSLPPEIGKLTPEELFSAYDGTQMAFNPTIPIPKICEVKNKKKGRFVLQYPELKKYCRKVIKMETELNSRKTKKNICLDFYKNFIENIKLEH